MRCGGKVLEKAEQPIQFLAAWTIHPNYDATVDNAWKLGRRNVLECVSRVKQDSIAFNKDQFGNIFY